MPDDSGGPAAPLPTVAELASHVAALLGADRYGPSEHGVMVDSARLVRRLGLALDGDDRAARWAGERDLDALWLHRPWRVPRAELPGDVGVWFTHLPFDDRLTTGLNPRLATALGCTDIEPFGEKDGRLIGMLARTVPRPSAELRAAIEGAFGGADAWVDGREPDDAVRRVAVVGAMTEALVRGAADRGATLYVTGDLRAAGLDAVRATGMRVAAVGHGRAEAWGVRALAGLLRERWAALEVLIGP